MTLEPARLRRLTVPNLRYQIEERVRDAIVSGTYQLGEQLVETTIAGQLGVSRAPVREVLSALERDGLVTSIPRRGYFVIDFAEKDIEEIYSLRQMIESGALARAMPRFTDANIDHLQDLVYRLGEAASQRVDPASIVDLDLEFHEYLVRAADHSRLYWVWNSVRWQARLLIGVTSKTHYTRPSQPLEYHQSILSAIRSQNLALAKQALADHILDGERRALAALKLRHDENGDE